MPKGSREAFLSKVTFRRESNWCSRTKQMLKDMKTIDERAELNLQYERDLCGYNLSDNMVKRAYLKGATEQKAIDDAEYQKLRKLAYDMYNAALYLSTDASVLHKAKDKFKEYIVYKEKKEE